MIKKGFVFLIVSFLCFAANAQNSKDSIILIDETQNELPLVVVDTTNKHSPRKAALFSAIIPGAGQIYNRKYWKAPVVYVGFGALVLISSHYNENYHNFKSVYEDALADTNAIPSSKYTVASQEGYSIAVLKAKRDFYRKYRDLCYIGLGLWYIMNIIDANVDAHFFDFDVDEDLSFHLSPATDPKMALGLSVSLRF